MNPLLLAVTLQLALYAVAIIAIIVVTVRCVRLQRLAARTQTPANWWEGSQAREALSHALRPLWVAAAALLLGAFVPRLLGALG